MPSVLSFLGMGLCSVGSALAQQSPAPAASPVQERTADGAHKKIQLFKGMPVQQFYAAMNFMSASLGVFCTHCHVATPGSGTSLFDKDDKETKHTARRMIAMVRRINAENFGGKPVVTCATCHQGHPRPTSLPPAAQDLIRRENAQAARALGAGAPSVEAILDAYLQALGGREALAKQRSRQITMEVTLPNGTTETQAVVMAPPNRLLVTETTAKGEETTTGYDGAIGWERTGGRTRELHGRDLDILLKDVVFNREIRLKELYPGRTFAGEGKVGEREAFLIDAVSTEGVPERWWFDKESGLLLRRVVEIRTPLGNIADQTDFADYRTVDGVKLPFLLRRASQWTNATSRVTEVRHDVPVDEKAFAFSPSGS